MPTIREESHVFILVNTKENQTQGLLCRVSPVWELGQVFGLSSWRQDTSWWLEQISIPSCFGLVTIVWQGGREGRGRVRWSGSILVYTRHSGRMRYIRRCLKTQASSRPCSSPVNSRHMLRKTARDESWTQESQSSQYWWQGLTAAPLGRHYKTWWSRMGIKPENNFIVLTDMAWKEKSLQTRYHYTDKDIFYNANLIVITFEDRWCHHEMQKS